MTELELQVFNNIIAQKGLNPELPVFNECATEFKRNLASALGSLIKKGFVERSSEKNPTDRYCWLTIAGIESYKQLNQINLTTIKKAKSA